jgi:hypothetical protein
VGPGSVTVTVVVAETRMAEEKATTEVVNFIVRRREMIERVGEVGYRRFEPGCSSGRSKR